MKQGLSLRTSQHLALTPQLQQSIRLLQLSTMELSSEVDQMLDDNPFLERTEAYRRDLRRVEYGDERDPAMRAFLERISPVNNAAKIGKPLFVAHGKNDPRVPYTEAEQIVEIARRNGTPVWYLLAANEGHGFAKKENADFYYYATIRFLQETVLK